MVTCAAMGNENEDKIHAKVQLENVGDEGYIAFFPNLNDVNYVIGAGEQTDSIKSYDYVPGIYDKETQTFTAFTDDFLDNSKKFYWASLFDVGSHQQCFEYFIPDYNDLATELDVSNINKRTKIKF